MNTASETPLSVTPLSAPPTQAYEKYQKKKGLGKYSKKSKKLNELYVMSQGCATTLLINP